MKEHHEETDRFRDIYDMFVLDATHLNEQNCTKDYMKCMEHVLKTRGQQDQPDDIKSVLNSMEIDKLVKHRDEYRMYSFKQLYNIVNIVTDNSTINDRLKKAEGNVADIYNKLEEQTKARVELKQYTDEHFNKTMIKMENMTHAQDLVNDDK